MAISFEATKASKGLTKKEATDLLNLIVSHKTTFNIGGGFFEQSSLDRLPEKEKVNFWMALIVNAKRIPIPIARHILSRIGFDPKGKTVEDINGALKKAMASLKA